MASFVLVLALEYKTISVIKKGSRTKKNKI